MVCGESILTERLPIYLSKRSKERAWRFLLDPFFLMTGFCPSLFRLLTKGLEIKSISNPFGFEVIKMQVAESR